MDSIPEQWASAENAPALEWVHQQAQKLFAERQESAKLLGQRAAFLATALMAVVGASLAVGVPALGHAMLPVQAAALATAGYATALLAYVSVAALQPGPTPAGAYEPKRYLTAVMGKQELLMRDLRDRQEAIAALGEKNRAKAARLRAVLLAGLALPVVFAGTALLYAA